MTHRIGAAAVLAGDAALDRPGLGTHRLSATAPAILSLRNVSFSYEPSSVEVLSGIDLDVRSGDITALCGASGCGKSTLLRICGGLLSPTKGSVAVAGSEARRCNFVFQDHGLFPWMTIIENVAFGPLVRGVSRRARLERATRELAEVGLSGWEHSYPHQLSGGMRQRASIARAFANDPDILLLDEPFAALAVQTRALMQTRLLQRLEKTRITVIFVTHAIDEALLIADRVVVMKARPGRIVCDRAVDFPHPRDARTLRAASRFSDLTQQVWDVIADDVHHNFNRGLD